VCLLLFDNKYFFNVRFVWRVQGGESRVQGGGCNVREECAGWGMQGGGFRVQGGGWTVTAYAHLHHRH
jgi:hypothetical protein